MAWIEIGPDGTWVCGKTFRGGRYWVEDPYILAEARKQTGVEVDFDTPAPQPGEAGYVAPVETTTQGPLTTADLGRVPADETRAVEKVEREVSEPDNPIEVVVPKSRDAIVSDVKMNAEKAPRKGQRKVKEEAA